MKKLIKIFAIILMSLFYITNIYAEYPEFSKKDIKIKKKKISVNNSNYDVNILDIKGKEYELNGCSVKKYLYLYNSKTKPQIIILCQLTGYNGLLDLFTITKLNNKYEEEEIQNINNINEEYGDFIKIYYLSFDGFDYYLSAKTNKNDNIIIKNGYVIFSEKVNKTFLNSYSETLSNKIIKKIDILIQKKSKKQLIKILNKLEKLPLNIVVNKKYKNIISYLKYKIKNEIFIKRPILIKYKKTYALFLNNKLIKKIDNSDYLLKNGIYTLNSKFKNIFVKNGILNFIIESYNYNSLTKNHYNYTKEYFYDIKNNIFLQNK